MRHTAPSTTFDRATASRPRGMTPWQKERAYGPIIPLRIPRPSLWQRINPWKGRATQ